MPVIDLANPTRFLTVVNRVLPWLIAATVILFAVGSVPRDERARRLSARRHCQNHVPACACCLAWHVRLGSDERRGAWHAGVAASAGRRRRQGSGADRRSVHLHLSRDRIALGPPDLGHLLGVGRAADLDAGAVAALLSACSHSIGPPKSLAAARARRQSCHWSARSTFQSSSFQSTGGIRCISPPRYSEWVDQRSIRRS